MKNLDIGEKKGGVTRLDIGGKHRRKCRSFVSTKILSVLLPGGRLGMGKEVRRKKSDGEGESQTQKGGGTASRDRKNESVREQVVRINNPVGCIASELLLKLKSKKKGCAA